MTMTAAPHSIDPTTYLDDLLAQASPDLMRQMLQGSINQILSAQADTVKDGNTERDTDTRGIQSWPAPSTRRCNG